MTDPWLTYALYDSGFEASFPARPNTGFELIDRSRRLYIQGLLACCEKGNTTYCFGLNRGIDYEGERPGFLNTETARAELLRGIVEQSAAPPFAGFAGQRFTGYDADGNRRLLLAYELPDALFYAFASGRGNRLDLQAVTRFFDSLRLRMGWATQDIPELGLLIDVPVLARMVRGKDEFNYLVGGTDELSFAVTMERVQPDVTLADAVKKVALSSDIEVISIEYADRGGHRGRDIIATKGHGFVRDEMFLVEDRLYSVSMTASSLAPLRRDSWVAERYFRSLEISVDG